MRFAFFPFFHLCMLAMIMLSLTAAPLAEAQMNGGGSGGGMMNGGGMMGAWMMGGTGMGMPMRRNTDAGMGPRPQQAMMG